MTTTTLTEALPIDGRATEQLIGVWLMYQMKARDQEVADNVLSFTIGVWNCVPSVRVQVRRTGEALYSVKVGHVEKRTWRLVVDQERHGVAADELHEAVKVLTDYQ
jgi:hypothetical protein